MLPAFRMLSHGSGAPVVSADRDRLASTNAEPAYRVLYIETSEARHKRVLAALRNIPLALRVRSVRTQAECERALQREWDLVLSACSATGFPAALTVTSLEKPGWLRPLILLVDDENEHVAAAAMRAGVSDYLLSSNLTRLGPALERAIAMADAMREQQRIRSEFERSRQRLRELTQHLQVSVEAERVSIAREIHDEVGGSLTAIKFDLAWMAQRAGRGELAQRARQALETVTHAIGVSQRIMHNLRPTILEQGLVAALQWMADRFEKRTGIPTRFSSTGVTEVQRWPPQVALTAYRTAQEALTNISKYAQASRVEIDLTLARGVLSLEISDNGRGMSQEDLSKPRSYGIRGLRERANIVNGWIDLSSGARGTTLILSVPLHKARREAVELNPVIHDVHNDPTVWDAL